MVHFRFRERGDNLETNRVNPNYIYTYICDDSSRQIQRYQTWRDSTKLKSWWRHFRFSMNKRLWTYLALSEYIYFSQSKVEIYGSFMRKKCHFRFRKKEITRKRHDIIQ